MAQKGMDADEITLEIDRLIPKVEASFIINRLDYLAKGGRCSSLVAMGANVLHLRPMILVKDGKMEVGKKYRGSYDDCMVKYIKDRISGRDNLRLKRIFITLSLIHISPSLLPGASHRREIKAQRDGYFVQMDAQSLSLIHI